MRRPPALRSGCECRRIRGRPPTCRSCTGPGPRQSRRVCCGSATGWSPAGLRWKAGRPAMPSCSMRGSRDCAPSARRWPIPGRRTASPECWCSRWRCSRSWTTRRCRRAKSYGRRCWKRPVIFVTATTWTCCQPPRCGAPGWRAEAGSPRLEEAIPGAADPEISAAELIAEVAEYDDAAQRLEAASEWLEQHHPREILEAAESMSPLLRPVAADLVERLGEYAVPAWREFTAAPHVGPHARCALYAWDQGPEPGERDFQWLGTESAAAALDGKGPDEALCVVWESVRGEDLAGRLAVVRATGHPAAGKLARAVTGFTASGASRSIDQGVQLRVTLKHGKPAVWRSVRLPVIATLGDLHQVIQLLFGWDGDHLHTFQVGRRAYSDPSFPLEDAADEDGMRVRDACRPGVKVGYEYDFGASWQHEITSQKAFRLDPDQSYPVCVAYQGDSPVEYPSEENPQEPEPFSLTGVNRKLAKLGR